MKPYKTYSIAVSVGKNILEKGSNAMNAILAMQIAVGLTEMHASGIGGGSYIMYFNKEMNNIKSFDERESSPKDIDFENFRSTSTSKAKEYKGFSFEPSLIATPGILKAMKLAYNEFGFLR